MAHFSDVNEVDGTKGINWKRFVAKYKDSILEDDEILGYRGMVCEYVSLAYDNFSYPCIETTKLKPEQVARQILRIINDD